MVLAGWVGWAKGATRYTHTETPHYFQEGLRGTGASPDWRERGQAGRMASTKCGPPTHRAQGGGMAAQGARRIPAQIPASLAPLPRFRMLTGTARASGQGVFCERPQHTQIPENQVWAWIPRVPDPRMAPLAPRYLAQGGNPGDGPTCSEDGQREVCDGLPGVGCALGPAGPRSQDG